MLVASRLRHTITIQKSVSTSDSVGDATLSYETVAVVRAEINPLSTRDRFLAAQSKSEATHRVVVRYDERLADMDGSWRLLFGDRTFMVEGRVTNTNERNREMIIVAIEGLQ